VGGFCLFFVGLLQSVLILVAKSFQGHSDLIAQMSIAHAGGYVEFVGKFADSSTEFINGQFVYVTD
jgi:hypothetical protein